MKHLANALSLFRIVSLPAIIVLLDQEGMTRAVAATVLFVAAFLTDTIDGYVARKFSQETRFGSFLDFFADKLLLYGLFIFFIRQGLLPFQVFFLFILRDLVGAGIRWRASREDIQVTGLSTWAQMSQVILALGLLFQVIISQAGYSAVEFPHTVVAWLIALGVIVATISIFAYILVYLRALSQYRSLGRQLSLERMVILGNPKSRGYHDGYRRRLLKKFAKRRQAFLHFLPAKKDIFQGARRYLRGAELVVIAGGDGTFEGALNYRPFWAKALGFFPFGAGNAYYSQFYRGKRFQYLRSRFPFRQALFDVLEISWDGRQRQTGFLSVGLDAEVARLSGERTQHGLRDYVRAATNVAFRMRTSYNLKLIVGRRRLKVENCVNVTLGKIPFIGYGLRSLVGATRQDDGLIYGSAVVNRHSPRWNKVARGWGLLIAQMNIDKPPLFGFKGKMVEISSDEPFPLQAGGEFLGYTQKITVKVVRQQKVLVI